MSSEFQALFRKHFHDPGSVPLEAGTLMRKQAPPVTESAVDRDTFCGTVAMPMRYSASSESRKSVA
jgi:hypothetical protein